MNLTLTLATADWIHLFTHFLSLSLLAVGGAITTAPDMHRFLVDEQHWLTETQFTSSIAIAQAAPGPNVLFIALMGWNTLAPMMVLVSVSNVLYNEISRPSAEPPVMVSFMNVQLRTFRLGSL